MKYFEMTSLIIFNSMCYGIRSDETTHSQELKKELESIVGIENVHGSYYDISTIHLEQYADVMQFRHLLDMPKLVVRPSTAEEVVSIVPLTNRLRVPIIPMGGATALYAWGEHYLNAPTPSLLTLED
jgi:hypothetical protein